MTTLNHDFQVPPTLSGLTTTSGDSLIKLRWDTSAVLDNFWATEIWVSSTNDRSAAILANTERGSSYSYTTTPSSTRYFWIRAKGNFNQTNGAWYPESSTGGISGVSNPSQIALVSGTSVITVADQILTNTTLDLSTWNTWNTTGYLSFTAPADAVITFELGSNPTSVASLTTEGDIVALAMRARLYNYTDSLDVLGVTKAALVSQWTRGAVLTVKNIPDTPIRLIMQLDSGPLGVLTAGKTYLISIEYIKYQPVGTGGTVTLTEGLTWWALTDAATYVH